MAEWHYLCGAKSREIGYLIHLLVFLVLPVVFVHECGGLSLLKFGLGRSIVSGKKYLSEKIDPPTGIFARL